MRDNLPNDFTSWTDQVLINHASLPAVAFNFNLYERSDAFAVGLIGATRYDPDDPDWPCYESFSSGEDLFELPHSLVGNDWKQGLEVAKSLISGYLQRGLHAGRLKSARAVCVGFMDGDLEVVSIRKDTSGPNQPS